MTRKLSSHTILAIAAIGFLFASQSPLRAQQVKLVQHPATIDVQIDGKLFTTYHFNDDFFYKPVRPFLWPVTASDGVKVTTDQQQTDPTHGYQRSIWIGHGDVNGTNHWKFKTDPLARQAHLKFDWVKPDGFQEELAWTDKAGKPMLQEARMLRFRAYPDGTRGIELSMTLTAIAGDVVFGTKGDRGLLSVRAIESLYHTPVFTSAEGTDSCQAPDEPKDEKDAAKDQPPVPGVHTAWCDESGPIDNATYGIAIFDHPDNPRHPTMWHAHRDARLSPDMFSLDKSAKGDAHQGAYTIPNGKSVTLRYEIVIHKGPASAAGLKDKYAEFTGAK